MYVYIPQVLKTQSTVIQVVDFIPGSWLHIKPAKCFHSNDCIEVAKEREREGGMEGGR